MWKPWKGIGWEKLFPYWISTIIDISYIKYFLATSSWVFNYKKYTNILVSPHTALVHNIKCIGGLQQPQLKHWNSCWLPWADPGSYFVGYQQNPRHWPFRQRPASRSQSHLKWLYGGCRTRFLQWKEIGYHVTVTYTSTGCSELRPWDHSRKVAVFSHSLIGFDLVIT